MFKSILLSISLLFVLSYNALADVPVLARAVHSNGETVKTFEGDFADDMTWSSFEKEIADKMGFVILTEDGMIGFPYVRIVGFQSVEHTIGQKASLEALFTRYARNGVLELIVYSTIVDHFYERHNKSTPSNG